MAAPTSGERGGGSRSAWLLSQQCLPLQYQKTSQNNTICQQKVTHAEWLRRIGLETTIPAGLAFVGGTGEVATNLEELEAAGDRGTFRQTWTTHPHPYQTACGAKPLPAESLSSSSGDSGLWHPGPSCQHGGDQGCCSPTPTPQNRQNTGIQAPRAGEGHQAPKHPEKGNRNQDETVPGWGLRHRKSGCLQLL
ncbi:uncharacterized protein LOC112551239 isoform X2 [Alligator sinensis]|uniref:Uncharacterized protein LOC112551239 isoform X2 n=1 Tax=Alligator sinensis TaxID=38654 RepID=A0A3Q0H4A5_ALLSI|nr:uncharacterized protein LOC112551239 isoform X2 [Alligator sinensis]